MHRAAGFSLIELMTTIVVITVVLAIGVPTISSLRTKSELAAVTNSLTGGLNLARSEAVKQGIDVQLAPQSGGWNDGWVVRTTVSGSDAIRLFPNPSAGATVTPKSGATAIVVFEPLGNVAAAECFDISVTGGGVRSVGVAPGGRVAMSNTACP